MRFQQACKNAANKTDKMTTVWMEIDPY